MNKDNAFLYGKKKFGNATMGLSITATWAMGLSVVVGMEIVQTKGALAFLLYALANSLTLLLFGWIANKSEAKKVRELLETKVYKTIMILMMFMSILMNLTAIKKAMSMLQLSPVFTLSFIFILFLIVFFKGFDINVQLDVLQICMWLGLMIGAAFTSIYAEKLELPALTSSNFNWALYSMLLLFTVPPMDRQLWQRVDAMRHKTMKPFAYATVLMAIHLALVYFLASRGDVATIVIAIIILLVAGSTLQSALSAISTFGSTTKQGRAWMLIAFLGASTTLALDISLLTLWSAYGAFRLPFGIFLIGVAVYGAYARRKKRTV